MALILVGQSELWEKLKLQSYAAIRQRIDLTCLLVHLDLSETITYSYLSFPMQLFRAIMVW